MLEVGGACGLGRGLPEWAGPAGRGGVCWSWAGFVGMGGACGPGRAVGDRCTALAGRRRAVHSQRSQPLSPPDSARTRPVSAPPGRPAGRGRESQVLRGGDSEARPPPREALSGGCAGGRGGGAGRGRDASRVFRPAWRSLRAKGPTRASHSLFLVAGPLSSARRPAHHPVQVGAGDGGGDLIAVTRDSSRARIPPGSPPWWRRPPRAPLSCRDWGGAALFPAAGTISGRPFPGGSHPLDSPGKRGPLPAGGRVRPRGLDLCPQSASPKAWDLRAGPGARLRAWGSHSVRACCASRAAAPLLVGEGAGAGWRQGPGWGAGRRREAPSRIALSRNVLCPAPPWLRPKYWPLPRLLLGVTCASSGSRRLGRPAL